MKNTNLKKERGITLVALVITIVVLLILAAVAIVLLSGENNIIIKEQEAKTRTQEGMNTEENTLDEYIRIANQQLQGESVVSLLKNAFFQDSANAQEKLTNMGFLNEAVAFADDYFVYIFRGEYYLIDWDEEDVVVLTEQVNSTAYAHAQDFESYLNTLKTTFLGENLNTFEQTFSNNTLTIGDYEMDYDDEENILDLSYYIGGDTHKDIPLVLELEGDRVKHGKLNGIVTSVIVSK